MKPAIPLATAVALLLTGCDLAPKYHVPVVTVPVTYKEVSQWSPATPADAAPRGEWWHIYGDPELDRLEGLIDAANPSLDAAQAQFDRARAFAAEAEAGLFPELDVGGHLSDDKQSAHRPLRSKGQPTYYGDNAIDAQASYEVDFWDRTLNSVRAGKAAAQASAADIATTRLGLHAELANAYVTLRGLDAQADLLRRKVDTYQKALTLTQNRLAGLIASDMDVSRAANQLDDARAQVADVASRRALVEHAIAVLVGVPPAGFSIARATERMAVPDIGAGVPATLLQRRPDIAAAERLMFAANANIGVRRAAFYPNISLNAAFGTQSTGLGLLALPNSFFALGPGLTMPLFDAGLREAQVTEAVAAYRVAVDDYKATILDAFAEVEDELSRLHWLGEEQRAEDAAAADAKKTLDTSMSLYEEGADSYLEVVTAQTAELSAERAALDLRTRRLEATVALIRALGGGWSDNDLPAMAQAS